MNFGSKKLIRPGLILAVMLLTPAWAHAQMGAAARSESVFREISFQDSLVSNAFIDPAPLDRAIFHPWSADEQSVDLALEQRFSESGDSDREHADWGSSNQGLALAGPLESASHLPGQSTATPATVSISEPWVSEPLLFESGLAEQRPLRPITAGAEPGLSDWIDTPEVEEFDDASLLSASSLEGGSTSEEIQAGATCPHCGNPRVGAIVRPPHRRSPHRVCDVCGCDVQGKSGFGPGLAMRFGWWGTTNDGSPVKVGEFQDLGPSPFWDFDGVWSDRRRTLDFTLTGLDNEANQARAFFYGPRITTQFEYQRFFRRLDHVPLSGFDINTGTPGPTDKVVSEDLNVGEDYAIRVQQLDATVKGKLTQDLKWKVNLWGMRKAGERQANAMAHCFNITPPPGAANYTCHVLSQRQSIDWTTMEITPSLEARIGDSVAEYSRTMRAFGQNDQVVERTYTAFDFSPSFGTEGPPFVYGWVPENFTQIDRLKLNVPLNDANQLYAHAYVGNTRNEFRGTRRRFNGFDLRLTNRSWDDVTLTAYSKLDTQRNNLPTSFLTSPPFGVNSGPAGTFEPSSLRHPIDYTGARVGLKGNWQSPSKNWLSFAGGYEYFDLARSFATYNTLSGPFTQEDTHSHLINFGPYFRVSSTLDTYIRYKGGFIDNPLIGVREADGMFNTNQPEQVHRIELGGTWNPTPNFIATCLFGIENSWHRSQFANFDEDNYPILFTIWYAPTDRLSLTGGYAFMSNWIDQDVTIGFLTNPTERTRWNYGGYNNLVSCGARFSYSKQTQFVGGFQWDRGSNVFSVPASPAGADWSLLPTFSDVIVETRRVNFGIDHEFGPSMNAYFRYVHFDFEDLSEDFNSGTTDMFLGGFTILR